MRRVIKPDKIKKRYILIEFLLHTPNYFDLKKKVMENFSKIFGSLKLENSELRIIKNLYDEKKGICVIQIKRTDVIDLKFSLLFLRKINEKSLIIKTSKVYGTLKKHKKELGIK